MSREMDIPIRLHTDAGVRLLKPLENIDAICTALEAVYNPPFISVPPKAARG